MLYFFAIYRIICSGDYMKEIEKKIISSIDKMRPFLISEGGDIEYIKFEDGIVYVRLFGNCSNCPMMDVTLKDGIEVALINEIPEVIEVRNIDEHE